MGGGAQGGGGGRTPLATDLYNVSWIILVLRINLLRSMGGSNHKGGNMSRRFSVDL